MHHASLLTLMLAVLSTASAYAIPANQPDGIYEVRRSPSGEEIHTALNLPSERRTSANPLAKRAFAFGHTHCGCGIKLNTGDTDAAVADLENQLGKAGYLIDASMSYYSIRGGVVAFVCNDEGNAALKASSDIVGQALAQITKSCGRYVAGSTGWVNDFSIGYMNNAKDLDFCGASLGAPADHC